MNVYIIAMLHFICTHIKQNCKAFPLYSELNKHSLMSRLQKWPAKLIVCPSPPWLGWSGLGWAGPKWWILRGPLTSLSACIFPSVRTWATQTIDEKTGTSARGRGEDTCPNNIVHEETTKPLPLGWGSSLSGEGLALGPRLHEWWIGSSREKTRCFITFSSLRPK